MNHLDLGSIDTAITLFGGPYSNLQATQAVLDEVRDVAICTGDVVAYCAQPAETVRAVRGAGCVVVAGNCEKQLAAGAGDCGCGFADGSACDVLSRGWYAFASAKIGAQDRQWMQNLPDIATFSHHGLRYAVIHGGFTNISRFIWPISPQPVFEEEIAAIEAHVGPVDGVIAGHCGIAFSRQVGGVKWINAGVIGMPANNGAQHTAYAVLRAGEIDFFQLTYDSAQAADAMVRAGLTQGYDRALLTGYWPSEDVLPPDLRRRVLASG